MLAVPLCLVVYPHAIWLCNFYHKGKKVSLPNESAANVSLLPHLELLASCMNVAILF